MTINVDGVQHRLYFRHEEVPSRYAGPDKRCKDPQKNRLHVTERTECILDVKAGQEGDKAIWQPVATGAVYRSFQDMENRRQGLFRAFSRMMENLPSNYTHKQREQIGQQFTAARPPRASRAQLRKENARLRAKVARYEEFIDPTRLDSKDYVEYLKNLFAQHG
jgi:hypothetical protein